MSNPKSENISIVHLQVTRAQRETSLGWHPQGMETIIFGERLRGLLGCLRSSTDLRGHSEG